MMDVIGMKRIRLLHALIEPTCMLTDSVNAFKDKCRRGRYKTTLLCNRDQSNIKIT